MPMPDPDYLELINALQIAVKNLGLQLNIIQNEVNQIKVKIQKLQDRK